MANIRACIVRAVHAVLDRGTVPVNLGRLVSSRRIQALDAAESYPKIESLTGSRMVRAAVSWSDNHPGFANLVLNN